MTLEAIKSELRRQPFKPFALVLADGQEVIVPHHDHLLFWPDKRTMMVFVSLEEYRIVDSKLVTRIIPGSVAAGAA